MCSVGAILSNNNPLPNDETFREFTAELIRRMSARGTDATGLFAVYDDGSWWLRKAPITPYEFANKLVKIRFNDMKPLKYILLHTRAATVCPPSKNSCNHPIYYKTSNELIIALVHNGVLSNMPSMKELPPVDTAFLLQKIIENGLSHQGFRAIAREADGSYAVITADNMGTLGFMRNTSPLSIALVEADETRFLVLASLQEFIEKAAKKAGYEVVDVAYIEECNSFIVKYEDYVPKFTRRIHQCGYSSYRYSSCKTC